MLQGVTLSGTLDFTRNDTINVTGSGLSLSGATIHMDSGGALNFTGTQTLAGTGAIHFTEGSINLTGSGGKLTIASGITLDGHENDVYNTNINANSGTIDNQGTIDANVGGGTGFSVTSGTGGAWTNDGTLESSTGGSLNLNGSWTNDAGHSIIASAATINFNGSWTNQGTISSQGASSVNLGGNFTLATLGSYTRDPSGKDQFVIVGTLTLTGHTLDASAGPGKWALNGGSVIGGTIATTLFASAYGTTTDTLQDVTLTGTLNFPTNDTINIAGSGLSLSGATIHMDGGGALNFTGTQTLAGTGSIHFTEGSINLTGSGGKLTIASGITLDGHENDVYNTNINANSGTIDNKGTIDANVGGGTGFSVTSGTGGSWTNEGTLESTTGGNLNLTGSWTNSNATTIALDNGSSLSFSGTWTDAAPVTLAGGSTFNINGSWSNSLPIVASKSTVNLGGGNWSNSGSLTVDQSTLNLSGNWLNSGDITATGGSTLNLNGTWSNTAPISVTSTGTLSLGGSWTNSGSIDETASTVNLGGTFKTSQLGTLSGSGGTFNLTGTLTNDAPLALNGSTITPSYLLRGGTILGGTVTTTAGASLTATQQGGTLDGVTFDGRLIVGQVINTYINVADGLTLSNSTVTVQGNGTLRFMGSQTLGGTASISFADSDTGNGLVVPAAGDSLTISSGIAIAGNTGVVGSSSGGSITVSGSIASDGGGTISVEHMTNFAAGTLTGGTWQASGSGILRLIGANITTNASTIVLDGSSSRIFSDTATTSALAGFATNSATGSFALRNGASFTPPSSGFQNAGAVTIGASSALGAAAYTQSGGSTALQSGTLGAAPSASVKINGGSLSGPGTLSASLTNNGAVDLGSAPGILSILGTYTQTAAGTLSLKVGGTTAGTQLDQVNVAGTAVLNGTLNVALINGFGPNAGETFSVLKFAGSTGSFATFNVPLIPPVGGVPAFVSQSTPTSFDLVAATSSADLAVDPASISVSPSKATTGQNVTVHFTVMNQGTVSATGSWTDSVYLSADTALSADDLLIGRVTHSGDLAGLSSYTGTLTAPLPGVTDGSYHVVVVADSRMQVPDDNRSNNVAALLSATSASTPVLSLNTLASGDIASGQNIYYRLNVPPGANVELDATFGVANESELLVKYAAAVSESSHDLSPADPASLSPQIILPTGQGGPYYILLHGEDAAGAGQTYTLKAHSAALAITSTDPASAGNQGPVVLNLTGTGFTSTTSASLTDGSGHTISAVSMTFIDSSHVAVAFDLTGQTAGNYTIQVENGVQTAQAPGTFQVNSQSTNPQQTPPLIKTVIISPSSVKVGEPIGVSVAITNDSLQTVSVPLTETAATDANLIFPSATTFGDIVLAPHQTAGFGMVFDPDPHAAHTVSTFSLGTAPSQAPIDWSDQERDEQKPATLSASAWDPIWTNYTAAMGADAGSIATVLKADESYFASLGESVTDAQAIDFEEEKANDSLPTPILATALDTSFAEPGIPLSLQRSFVQSISGRNQKGLLGLGWTTNWDFAINTDENGLVYISRGPVTRTFAPGPDGSFVEAGGGTDVLSRVNDAYVLHETDGTVVSFYSDNQFNSIEDKYGNAITAGYQNGVMAYLESSSGDRLNFSYNALGHITQASQPDGQTVTYTYDAEGDHLIGVTNAQGHAQYVYLTDRPALLDNALASITNPDGTHVYFDYDAQGRLIEETGDNDLGKLTYAYLSPAGYTVTDTTGATTTVLVDVDENPVKITDPLGNVTRVTYDSSGHPILTTYAGGSASSTSYDSAGRPIVQVDPLGNTSEYTYDSQSGNLQTFQNALGATTSFAYDAQGTVATVTAPDSTTQQFVHDAAGRLTQTTDALGHSIHITYNASGQVTREDFADGSFVAYTYDAHGNVAMATDASGTTTLTHGDASYPSLLTRITYPNGQFLAYAYDNVGRETSQVDQDGFTENFAYDDHGRLSLVTGAGRRPDCSLRL